MVLYTKCNIPELPQELLGKIGEEKNIVSDTQHIPTSSSPHPIIILMTSQVLSIFLSFLIYSPSLLACMNFTKCILLSLHQLTHISQ